MKIKILKSAQADLLGGYRFTARDPKRIEKILNDR
jgi:hypothetical protein